MDILDRLKEQAQWESDGFGPLCAEAAKEIERLRAACQAVVDARTVWQTQNAEQQCAAALQPSI